MQENIEMLVDLLSDSEREHFESLAPSYKKIFVNHAFKSKVEKTRLKNIEEVREAMELKCKNMHEYKKKVNVKQETPSEELNDEQSIELYFNKVENEENREIVKSVYKYLLNVDPGLSPLYAWNSPMIQSGKAFNCGITVAKAHYTLAFDVQALEFFEQRIIENGYDLKAKTFSIKYKGTLSTK